jgi:hypothetical protein
MGDLTKMGSAAELQTVMRDAFRATHDPGRVAEYSAREAARKEREVAYRAGLWRRRYRSAAPVRVADAAWDARDTPAVLTVRDWLKDPSRHLVLRGGVGCGKTTAACVAVKHWVEPASLLMGNDFDYPPGVRIDWHERHDVAWLRPDQLVSAVLHDYDESSPKLRPYVVVDDMGVETKGDFAAALCELLDRSGHTVVITTNLTKARFRERYDLRLLDRLNDTARAIDLPEKSMRRQDGGF